MYSKWLKFHKNISFKWFILSINTSTHIYKNSSVSQLVFDPLQHFHEGTVTCQATVDNIERKANYTVTVNGKRIRSNLLIIFLICNIVISLPNKAPTISVNISDNGRTANMGRNFSLSCLIFGHENLAFFFLAELLTYIRAISVAYRIGTALR